MIASRLALAALLCLVLGCATPVPLLQRAQPAGPQWPEAPFKARIAWVKSVALPEDAGIKKSFWKRTLELFTGADKRGIVKPYGVFYDDAGRLFIADPGAGLVHLMETREGRYSTIVGPKGARLRSPIALAEDELGGLFITDSVANTVYRYDLADHSLTPFINGLSRPTGIAYNRVNKLLYIAETNGNRVLAVDRKGAVKATITAAGSSTGPFNRPTDLAVDSRGQIYVTDPLNYKVRILTPEGLVAAEFGAMGDRRGELNKPKGVAVDSEGHIYVCDNLLDAVQIFDESGQFLFSFGATGTSDGAFWMPSGMFIKGDFIFVSDSYNRRVQIFRYLPSEGREDL